MFFQRRIGPLRSVQAIFVWEIGFDVACALKLKRLSLILKLMPHQILFPVQGSLELMLEVQGHLPCIKLVPGTAISSTLEKQNEDSTTEKQNISRPSLKVIIHRPLLIM